MIINHNFTICILIFRFLDQILFRSHYIIKRDTSVPIETIISRMGCDNSIAIEQTIPKPTGRSRVSVLRHRKLRAIRSNKSNKGQCANLTPGNFRVTFQDEKMIERILINHYLLFKAKGYAFQELMSRLEQFQLEEQAIIFNKGDESTYFFIIINGLVAISDYDGTGHFKILQRGNIFGDLGLQYKALRSATARTLQPTQLLALHRDVFINVVLQLSKKAHNKVFRQIKSIPIFNCFTINQRYKLAYLAQQLRYNKHAVIFKKGQMSNSLYMVKQGKVLIQIPNKLSIELQYPQIFGQGCLKTKNSVRCASAICLQHTILYAFSKSDIIKYLGNDFMQLQVRNKLTWAIRQQQKLTFAPVILQSFLESKQLTYYTNGEMIAQKGHRITDLLVSFEGGISTYGQLQLINTDYLFGVKYLIKDLIKIGNGMVARLNIDKIQSKFQRKIQQLVLLDHKYIRHIQANIKTSNFLAPLQTKDFYVVNVIGRGNYGATLVVQTHNKMQFALKVMDIIKIAQINARSDIQMLATTGCNLNHNLISKLYKVIKQEQKWYFISQLIQGQDLFDLLQQKQKLTVPIVRHFSACILSIMEYLHSRRIVWRQMKIQSFVLDKQGYLMLVDLMYLQQVSQDQAYIQCPQRATVYYLAPQVLSGQAYGFQADFWAFGVILYKMITGKYPYGSNIQAGNPDIISAILSQIQNSQLTLPKYVPTQLKILLKILLNPNLMERGLISIQKIKAMVFLKDYDWLRLMERKIKFIPYLPEIIKNQSDEKMKLTTWVEYQELNEESNSKLYLSSQNQ